MSGNQKRKHKNTRVINKYEAIQNLVYLLGKLSIEAIIPMPENDPLMRYLNNEDMWLYSIRQYHIMRKQ